LNVFSYAWILGADRRGLDGEFLADDFQRQVVRKHPTRQRRAERRAFFHIREREGLLGTQRCQQFAVDLILGKAPFDEHRRALGDVAPREHLARGQRET
jgi:hypothetical protein